MNIDEEFKQRILKTFQPLNNTPVQSFPAQGFLSDSLKEKLSIRSSSIPPQLASSFAKASIEIWHRSVHSFLISISLANASPIWSSVSGYYSSHYSIRAIAHMLGYFYLYRENKLIKLELGRQGTYSYSLPSKPQGVGRSEHRLYWVLVKQNPAFLLDARFNENSKEKSDSAHRNFANYMDSLSKYNKFNNPLSKEEIKIQIDTISELSLKGISVPNLEKFPDIASVQLLAYNRIVIFRRILDEVLLNRNKFWNNNRNPRFAIEFMNFQLKEEDSLVQPS